MMTGNEKLIEKEREWDAWDAFKKAVEVCEQLGFNEKQLIAHINIKYCTIKGVVSKEGVHD